MVKKIINRVFHFLFSTADNRVKFYISCLFFCKSKNMRAMGLILSRRLQRKYGVFLSYQADFDDSLVLRHPIGIVIGHGVVIETDVMIYQNVTLGTSNKGTNMYPIIGRNTIIYSGAVIIGNVKVGKNCIIGANSVVTKDIPDNSVAVGSPARVITRIENKSIV